jgi:kelch-like protein 20
MNARFLVSTVSSDPLIRSDQMCRDLVDEAKDYLLLPQERLNMQGPRTRPRKPIKSAEVLFAGLLFRIFLFSKKKLFLFNSRWLVFR